MSSDNSDSGELRSGTEIIHGFIQGNKFDFKAIKASVIDGLALFEGDILLGAAQDIQNMTPANDVGTRGVGITGERFRWPKKIVPYSIDSNLPNPKRVEDAIGHWEQKSDFRFVKRGSDNGGVNHQSYISFEQQGGCFSAVGMQGRGKQVISLGPNCTTGNAIHEIGHALGLWHEQSREDRDRYVRIIWQNIEQDKWHNFEQHITDGDDIGGYDYGSIMHYPRIAFSKNGQETIIPRNNQDIGQRRGLSDGDIEAIARMYSNV